MKTIFDIGHFFAKTICVFIGLSLAFGCSNPNDNTVIIPDNSSIIPENKTTSSPLDNPHSTDPLSVFLNNFEQMTLPITMNVCQINYSHYQPIKGNIFQEYIDQNSRAYGQIQTNGNYFATLTLREAECHLPVLTTISKEGKVIDQKTIAIGLCGSDCGFSCEEFMTIKKDFTFYTSDTISSYQCDSLGNEISGTYEYYIIYQKGRLMNDGTIQCTDEIKQVLPGRKP